MTITTPQERKAARERLKKFREGSPGWINLSNAIEDYDDEQMRLACENDLELQELLAQL